MILQASDNITILFKRALNYLDADNKPIEKIAKFIPEYGEPLYLQDLDYLVIGDAENYTFTTDRSGSADEQAERKRAERETDSKIPQTTQKLGEGAYLIGATVEDLIKVHEYFAKVRDPKIWGNAHYQYLDSYGEPNSIPIDTKDTTIANCEFVFNSIEEFKNFLSNITFIGDESRTITEITQTNGKINVTFTPIKITYDQVIDGSIKKPLPGTANPKMDGTASPGVAININKYAREDHIHPTDTTRAPINGPQLKKTNGNTGNNPTTPDIILDGSDQQIVNKKYIDTIEDELQKQIIDASQKEQNKTDIIYVTGIKNTAGTGTVTTKLQYCGKNNSAAAPAANKDGVRINCNTGALFGAAWNDFAEFRECQEEPGTVVCETGHGDLKISEKRLQPGAAIISDTYGMVIGPENDDYSPIAVAGRVLAKPGEPLICYLPGMPVCAGPEGKIYAMTREESINYPEAILGYVSEIPTYDEWNEIKVNNRIWIKIK